MAELTGLLLFLGFMLFLAPMFLASYREHPNAAPIILVNVLLGWTVLGWVVALVWASTAIPASRPSRVPPSTTPLVAPPPPATGTYY